jgi:hypothetical protein
MRVGRLFSNVKLVATAREDFWQGAQLQGTYKILYKGEEAGRKILMVDSLFGSGGELPIGFFGKYGWKTTNGGYNDVKFKLSKRDLESYCIHHNGWIYQSSIWLPIWVEEGDYVHHEDNNTLIDLHSYVVKRPGSVPSMS